jgi:fructosamine-3-kinase
MVLSEILGQKVLSLRPLPGGCVGEVYQAGLAGGQMVVVKMDSRPQPQLHLEGFMLTYLAQHSHLPVPQVLHTAPELLVMEFLPGDSHFDAHTEQDAAAHLAALHHLTAPQFGLSQDTLIGGLPQPNPWTTRWLDFFRDHRLLCMARVALNAGQLPGLVMARLEKLAGQLPRWLEEPIQPSLIHGDVWTTNVLAARGRVTGFIDPAIYYAHPEIELAFITLFGTFGQTFFAAYQEQNPIASGFWEERRDLYNLYPLLVHVRLFGGGYVASVDKILRRFGF